MPFKLNISDKGKAYKLEIEDEILVGKSIGDKVDGKEIKPELEGYELEITGGSDSSGFPLSKDVEGIGFKRALLKKGFGMKSNEKGIRLRKIFRGKVVSNKTSQINFNVVKAGKTPLDKVFGAGAPAPAEGEEKKEEDPKEEKKEEEKPEEEKKEEAPKEEAKPEEKPAEEEKKE